MATLSFTLSQFAPNVKATHTGITTAGGAASISATISPSSIIHFCQVPNGATLVDFWVKFGGQAIDTQTMQIGTSQTPSGIMAATTLSLTFCASASAPTILGIHNQSWLRAPGGSDLLPVRISLSDDAQPSSIWVQGRLSKTVSGSFYITFLLFYTMDGLIGHTSIR